MARPLKFFITHSSEDSEFARRLGDDLRASGLDGFLDVHSIDPGEDFVTRINEGLEECDVFLPVLSRAALKSPWCEAEISAAMALSKRRSRANRPRIIPVLLEDCTAKLPPLLLSLLHVNFERRYLSGLWDLLVEGFGIDPKAQMHQASMFSGPILATGLDEGHGRGWFGAHELLTFNKDDAAIGKSLRIVVESAGHDLSIELWRGAYENDVSSWTKTRREVARSPRQRNPTLTWVIEPGTYTVYFVDEFRIDSPRRSWGAYGDPLPQELRYHILYRIEVLPSKGVAKLLAPSTPRSSGR